MTIDSPKRCPANTAISRIGRLAKKWPTIFFRERLNLSQEMHPLRKQLHTWHRFGEISRRPDFYFLTSAVYLIRKAPMIIQKLKIPKAGEKTSRQTYCFNSLQNFDRHGVSRYFWFMIELRPKNILSNYRSRWIPVIFPGGN